MINIRQHNDINQGPQNFILLVCEFSSEFKVNDSHNELHVTNSICHNNSIVTMGSAL